MQTAKSYRGHVANGRIALGEPIVLPEGAAVSVRLLKPGRRAGFVTSNPSADTRIYGGGAPATSAR